MLAACRGDGIPGQLDDEVAHQETFRSIAQELGGCETTPASIAALVAYLESLRGPESLAVLNIVAEHWLENVFRHVARWGIADELFGTIAEEEARHVACAMGLDRPAATIARRGVRELEKHLWAVASDPHFHVPLLALGGVRAVAAMSRENAASHENACAMLGVRPSRYTREIGRCGVDAEDDEDPRRLEPTAWERSAFRLDLGPIYNFTDARWASSDAADLEAAVVRGAARALERYPRLNRTISEVRGELYQPAQPVIAVRRVWRPHWTGMPHEAGLVMTIYARGASTKGRTQVRSELKDAAWRARALPYRETPDLAGLERLLPAPRAAVTVTNVSEVGVDRGYPALARLEGATIAVAVGQVRDIATRARWLQGFAWWQRGVTLGVVVDHRAHNGAELGLFSQELRREIESG